MVPERKHRVRRHDPKPRPRALQQPRVPQREHGADAGKRRLLFLGDSFVWGYDVRKEERFTERLEAALPDTEIFNFGVSGYSTDQEFLVLRREIENARPDSVFLMFAGNDRAGNSSNKGYGYFKPYFSEGPGGLHLEGVPVPVNAMYRVRTARPFFKNSYTVLLAMKAYDRLLGPLRCA